MLREERRANLVRGRGTTGPEPVEDGLLQLGQRAAVSVTRCHATDCNMYGAAAVKRPVVRAAMISPGSKSEADMGSKLTEAVAAIA